MHDSSTTTRLVIFNQDNHTRYELLAQTEALSKLKDLVLSLSSDLPKLESWGEGVDSAAVMGMSKIFYGIPQKFPVKDILIGLRDYIDFELPLTNIEIGLILLAKEQ